MLNGDLTPPTQPTPTSLKKPLLYSSTLVGIALLVVGWIFFSVAGKPRNG